MSNCIIIDEDLDKLLENLPFFINENLVNHSNKHQLIEIVMDLGRRPEARFTTGREYLSQKNYFMARY
jgi:stage III sporulation protein SpoIIIAA